MKNRARYPAWQIHIAEADPTEAKCFPGGTLVFFRGLLDDARSEATLVAVIAHELSHVDHGHQLNLLRRMKLAEQTFANPGAGGPRSFLQNGPLLMRAFTHPFRPEDETEADRDATQWSYELGYDPREFAELFQRLQQRAPVTVNLPAFLRTHPPHADRHRAILATFEELQRKSPVAELYVGRENLRRRLPREQQAFEE
jgi:predicted Zn-dependent protease